MNLIHKEFNAGIAFPGNSYRGEIRAILRNRDNEPIYDSGWFSNDFTTQGKAWLGYNNTYLAVGTGSSPTTPGTTSLDNEIYRAGSQIWDSTFADPDNDYEYSAMRRLNINPGDATGTIREIAVVGYSYIGGADPDGSDVISRQVLPIPIVKNAENSLEVFYRWYAKPFTGQVTGTVNIRGVNYTYKVNICQVLELSNPWGGVSYYKNSHAANFGSSLPLEENIENNWDYSGDGEYPRNMYRENSNIDTVLFKTTWDTVAYLNHCNFTEGIKAAYSRLNTHANNSYETFLGVGFTALDGPNVGWGVPKTDQQYFRVSWEIGW